MMAVPPLFFAVFDSSPCLRHDCKPRKLSLPRGRLGRFEDTVPLGYQNRKNLSIGNSCYSTLSATVSLAACGCVLDHRLPTALVTLFPAAARRCGRLRRAI